MHCWLKFMSVLSMCVASVAVAAPPIQAPTISQMTDWHISPITNIAGGAPYCIMAARFDSGLIMTFARNNANQYSLGIDGQQPYFDAGLNYGVKLSVGAQTRQLAAKASDQNLIVANLGQDTNLFDVAARGEIIHVVVANNVIDKYVKANSQAFFELAHCWQGLPKPPVPQVAAAKPPLETQPVAKAMPLPTMSPQVDMPIAPMAQDKARNLAPQAVIVPSTAPPIAPATSSGRTVLPTTGPMPAAKPVTTSVVTTTTPARDALADVLQQSRLEAAKTDKLNTQEAVMAKAPVKAVDTLSANKLVVPAVTPPPANLPAPVTGPRQKLAGVNEEAQLAKPVVKPNFTNDQVAQPIESHQRSKLLFDKAPAPAPSMIKTAPAKKEVAALSKPVTMAQQNSGQLRDAAKIFPQLGVSEKPDLSSPFTWEIPNNDSITGVVSVHKLGSQTFANFVAQRLAKAAQICGKNNFSPSQGPLQQTADGRQEIVVQSTCRKDDATSSVAIYEQAGNQVRHWQISGAMAEQAAMLQIKNNIQQQLKASPTIQPIGTAVPQTAAVN